MTSPLSLQRIRLTHALSALILVVILANILHHRSHQRHRDAALRRLENLQHLLVAAYQVMPPENFHRWLEHMDFDIWSAPGSNIGWIAPPATVRWSLHPVAPGDFFPGLLDTIREVAATPQEGPRRLRVRESWRWHLIHLEPLTADPYQSGLLLLRIPLPHILLDAHQMWSTLSLLAAALLCLLLMYQFHTRRRLNALLTRCGITDLAAFPGPGEALDQWSRRYAASFSRKIEEERGQFDSLFDMLQDGILFLDGEDRILRANAAAAYLLGQEPAALLEQPLPDAADQTGLADLTRHIRETQAYQSAELHLPTIPGPGHFAGIPLRTASDEKGQHLMLVMRDLSQIRRLESAGEEYATNVSHELKTPLTLILGYTETLLSHHDMEVEFRNRSLRTIERHTKRIIRIVDDLLRLAWLRNESGTTGIPRAPVDMAAVVQNAVELSDEWVKNAGIAIETQVTPGLVWSLNSGLIEEAIVNLVKNAILYALTGPVEVRAHVADNGHLQILVVDRGPGLKPEDANRIFDRFYRAEKSRSRALGGSGLGLPIVQQIVEAHHGTARVETAPGAGCTFILEIPPGPAGA